MANPSPAHEPSMEEILASIRQIISEDGEAQPVYRIEPESQPEAGQSAAPAASFAPQPSASASAPDQPDSQRPDAQPRANAAPAAPEAQRRTDKAAAAAARAAAEAGGRTAGEPGLLSADSDAVVSGAFSALAHTILSQNARTLEDLVAEMMRPMLKTWLDDNLPALVERLVKEEIERVSRGRR